MTYLVSLGIFLERLTQRAIIQPEESKSCPFLAKI
jgi:hypothetical protein